MVTGPAVVSPNDNGHAGEVSDRDAAMRAAHKAAYPDDYIKGTDEPTRGLRYNKGKRRYDLLPPDTMALLADLLTRGAEKYAERNWEFGMPYSDALGSLERHLMDWKAGVDADDETKMSHMIHVMCNAMFLATWQARKVGTDDRQKVTMPEPYVSSTNPSAS